MLLLLPHEWIKDVVATPHLNGEINGIGNIASRTDPDSARTRKNSEVGLTLKPGLEPGIVQSQSESAAPPSSNMGMERTMRWLLALFPSREPTTPIPTSILPEEKDVLPPPPVVHHRGEVNCLHYGTLDDSAMRRLEGRSDHRPILGTFSVYI